MTAARPAKPISGSFLDRLSDLDRSDLLSAGRPRAFRRGSSIIARRLVSTGRRRITIRDADRLRRQADDV